MPLTDPQLAKLLHMCRIELDSSEKKKLLQQLSKIIDYMQELDSVQLEKVQVPAAIPVHRHGDVLETPLERESLLSAAPEEEKGLIRVPFIL